MNKILTNHLALNDLTQFYLTIPISVHSNLTELSINKKNTTVSRVLCRVKVIQRWQRKSLLQFANCAPFKIIKMRKTEIVTIEAFKQRTMQLLMVWESGVKSFSNIYPYFIFIRLNFFHLVINVIMAFLARFLAGTCSDPAKNVSL
jgi:hypothetical protein